MFSTLWHHHYRPILLTLALATILIWVLALTQPHKLVEGVRSVKLAGCHLDYHTSIHALALALSWRGLYQIVASAHRAAMGGADA